MLPGRGCGRNRPQTLCERAVESEGETSVKKCRDGEASFHSLDETGPQGLGALLGMPSGGCGFSSCGWVYRGVGSGISTPDHHRLLHGALGSGALVRQNERHRSRETPKAGCPDSQDGQED
jgi:hypothetical protein